MKATKADRDAVLEVIRQHPEGISGTQIGKILPELAGHTVHGRKQSTLEAWA